MENLGIEFVELVSYCAKKCRTRRTVFWNTVAEHLNDLAGDFCQVSCLEGLLIHFSPHVLCAPITSLFI